MSTAEDRLRALVNRELAAAGISKNAAQWRIGPPTSRHIMRMLTGERTLSLAWAERILELTGKAIDFRTIAAEENTHP